MKTTGLEWKKFHMDDREWPNDSWYEDEEVRVDGDILSCDFDFNLIPANAIVSVSGGVFYDGNNSPMALQTKFNRWRRKQKTTVLLVEVPKDKASAVSNAIAAAGGKVKR